MNKDKLEQFIKNLAYMNPLIALPTLLVLLVLVLGVHFGIVTATFYLITLITGLAFTFINTAYFWLSYVFFSILMKRINPKVRKGDNDEQYWWFCI